MAGDEAAAICRREALAASPRGADGSDGLRNGSGRAETSPSRIPDTVVGY